ncbi:MAG: PEP-CTERM sorting domain-containing protein [Syntrophorhabdales bacterium]|jgi:hypothetical protein
MFPHFWTPDYFSGEVYEVNIVTGAIDEQWNAGLVGDGPLGGLAVFGEITPSNPLPEPVTMFLFGFGLIGLAGAARRRIK